MVTLINLSDLEPHKTAIITAVNRKIAKQRISNINETFDGNLKIDQLALNNLLTAIETKVRRLEMIYHSFLETADHGILCATSVNFPVSIAVDFSYSSSVVKERLEFNDRFLYKETVDLAFQNFILIAASTYENFVRLTEILIKKVIVFIKTKPLSTPMHDYRQYFDLLIRLGYRKQDHLYKCLQRHQLFLDQFLEPLRLMRNSFIHGSKEYLHSDGANYRLNFTQGLSISPGSPLLTIDKFSEALLNGSKAFFSDLMDSMIQSMKHTKKIIPV